MKAKMSRAMNSNTLSPVPGGGNSNRGWNSLLPFCPAAHLFEGPAGAMRTALGEAPN